MAIRVLADDGSIHQFPDDVADGVIPTALTRYHASLTSAPDSPQAPTLAQAGIAPKVSAPGSPNVQFALPSSISLPAGLIGAGWQSTQPAGSYSSFGSNGADLTAPSDDLYAEASARSIPVPFPVPPIAIPGSRENQEWSRWATPKVQWLLDRIGDAASDLLGPRRPPQCDRQYENDSAICRNLPAPAEVKEGCWSSASERKAYCIQHNGEVGWPPLQTR